MYNIFIELPIFLILVFLSCSQATSPYDYSGVDNESVFQQIEEILKMNNFQPAEKSFVENAKGKIIHSNLIITFPTRKHKCEDNIDVIYMVSTGSQTTKFTKNTMKALHQNCGEGLSEEDNEVIINERRIKVEVSEWQNINVLGMDFISKANAFKADYGTGKFYVVFSTEEL